MSADKNNQKEKCRPEGPDLTSDSSSDTSESGHLAKSNNIGPSKITKKRYEKPQIAVMRVQGFGYSATPMPID